MMERRQIIRLWQQGQAGVLATLVRVEGSSYRQTGARLLTGRTPGLYAGTVSGGCLETEVVRKAAWMVQGGAKVERYAMTFDDTADIPFGLGCGGTVDLLLEPAETAESEALFQAMDRSLRGQASTVISFLPGGGRGLRRLIFGDQGEVLFASPALSAEKIECARALSPGTSYEGRFVERLEPPQRLFVLGAGDDAKPVVQVAALLGWTVVVADGRQQLTRAERFPEAARVVQAHSAQDLGISEADACVIMTHSYEQDRDLLRSVLPLGPRYLGILGSRHRSSLLVTEAAETLGWSVARCCQGLYAPVGMDLGGDGPEAIALSIISEIQALCNGRLTAGAAAGGARRLTPREIAVQVEQGGSAQYLQTQCSLATEA